MTQIIIEMEHFLFRTFLFSSTFDSIYTVHVYQLYLHLYIHQTPIFFSTKKNPNFINHIAFRFSLIVIILLLLLLQFFSNNKKNESNLQAKIGIMMFDKNV